MKLASFTVAVLIMLVCSSCKMESRSKNLRDFGVFEMELDQGYSVKSIGNGNEMKWYVFNQKDSLYVVYRQDTTKKWSDPSSYGFDTKDIISLYDCYLSLNKKEVTKFNITYFDLPDAKARIVQRAYKKSGEYLEISFKNICDLPSVLQITGLSISEATKEAVINSSKSIRFKCY
jgi:hypothetical protein